MKKILITGKNSFVGNSFAEWIAQFPDNYSIEFISMRDEEWRTKNLQGFDAVLHVAGIAHVSTDSKMEELYYKVNCDMTIELAEKAKFEGVRQFIFMSSIIVYGDGTASKNVITSETVPNPTNFYGKSKLLAEEGIRRLCDSTFKVCIIRPPMIYGRGGKGNYTKLSKIARMFPLFPRIKNERSMIHVDNLSEFIRLMIENEEKGFFFPQNKEYVNTSELVNEIGKVHSKKVYLVSFGNFLIKPLIGKIGIFNKVFGNLVYEGEISKYKQNYRVRNFRESVKATEFGE